MTQEKVPSSLFYSYFCLFGFTTKPNTYWYRSAFEQHTSAVNWLRNDKTDNFALVVHFNKFSYSSFIFGAHQGLYDLITVSSRAILKKWSALQCMWILVRFAADLNAVFLNCGRELLLIIHDLVKLCLCVHAQLVSWMTDRKQGDIYIYFHIQLSWSLKPL